MTYDNFLKLNIPNKIAYELEYWTETGIHQDYINHYKKDIEMFGFNDISVFNNKIVMDVGCGPFGGELYYLNNSTIYGIAIDPLLEYYNKYNLQKFPLSVKLWVDGKAEDLAPDLKADFIFSCNTLDHNTEPNIDNVDISINNLINALNNNGTLCIKVHLRNKDQLNIGHDIIISEDRILTLINNKLKIKKIEKFKEGVLENLIIVGVKQ